MIYPFLGLIVGIAVGITGVGGTTLMTPLLLLTNIAPIAAVGTGLVFSFITKLVATGLYGKRKRIHWQLVGLLCLGSIPSSIITTLFLKGFDDAIGDNTIRLIIGITIIATAIILLINKKFITTNHDTHHKLDRALKFHEYVLTVICGVLVGILVTLTSLGAGVAVIIFLFFLYPRLKATTIVGTDLVHAVLLTAIASIGHMFLSHMDYKLIAWLLLGSLPGVYIGYLIGKIVSERTMRLVIALALLLMGIALLLHGFI